MTAAVVPLASTATSQVARQRVELAKTMTRRRSPAPVHLLDAESGPGRDRHHGAVLAMTMERTSRLRRTGCHLSFETNVMRRVDEDHWTIATVIVTVIEQAETLIAIFLVASVYDQEKSLREDVLREVGAEIGTGVVIGSEIGVAIATEIVLVQTAGSGKIAGNVD